TSTGFATSEEVTDLLVLLQPHFVTFEEVTDSYLTVTTSKVLLRTENYWLVFRPWIQYNWKQKSGFFRQNKL
ncbi:MAG: hypothetical protein ABIH45_05660, partial [Candidatus Omnitrophota bacterium]